MGDTDRQGRTTNAGEMLGRSQGSTKQKGALGGALSALGGALGNDELLARLGAGNQNRDDLLDFLVQRLAEMRTAQLAEVELAKATENSMRTTLAESESHHSQPNPRRWHQAAALYQQAAAALCSGQLHRGAELVEQAAKEDKRAFEQMSKFAKGEGQALESGSAPGGAPSSDTACTSCAEPDGVGVADEILRVSIAGNENLKGQRRELDPWWTDLEEEEEEEENGGS